jgi:hypothetical protein
VTVGRPVAEVELRQIGGERVGVVVDRLEPLGVDADAREAKVCVQRVEDLRLIRRRRDGGGAAGARVVGLRDVGA